MGILYKIGISSSGVVMYLLCGWQVIAGGQNGLGSDTFTHRGQGNKIKNHYGN